MTAQAVRRVGRDSDFDSAAQSMSPSQEWGQESKVASTCLTERLWRQHPGLVETRGCGSVE